MIKVENVSYSYEGDGKVLKNITFEAKCGESIGIIGANGAGKSTLLKTIVGLIDGYEGTISAFDMEVNKKNLGEIRKRIGYVFQDSESQLFMSSVYDDVAFGPRNYGMNSQEVDHQVRNALIKVNGERLIDKKTYKLSGGEKKIVSIATALATSPECLLMDEPTIALDPRNRRNLINLLNTFSQLRIIASHDLDMVMDTCRRVILIDKGAIVADGTTDDILKDKELLESHGLELPLRLL